MTRHDAQGHPIKSGRIFIRLKVLTFGLHLEVSKTSEPEISGPIGPLRDFLYFSIIWVDQLF